MTCARCPWRRCSWKVKVFALYAAPFEEVLLLDGDSTPLRDPAYLFDHPAFRRHGSMFFPDAGCAPLPFFRLLGRQDLWHGGARQWATESGQLLFNRCCGAAAAPPPVLLSALPACKESSAQPAA